MAKLQFASLEYLQRYLERGDIINSVFRDKKIQQALANEMSKAVHNVVYAKYIPQQYVRRGNSGGLSDTRNMHITKVEVRDGKVVILFENLTQGQTTYLPIYEQPIDSLHGQFITDTISDGIGDNWYIEGRWSQSRPFIQETIRNIKANPQPLINAIKSSYKKIGFNIK